MWCSPHPTAPAQYIGLQEECIGSQAGRGAGCRLQAAGCRLQAAGCVVLPRHLLDLLHLVGDPVAVLVEPAW